MANLNEVKISEEIKNQFRSKSPIKKPTKEIKSILEDLYIIKKFSQSKIAKIFGVQKDTIARWLKRCNIPLRNRYDSISISLSKYKTYPFSSDLKEKAYLIGIRYGDLSVQLHGRKIRISVSSTHPSMLTLFKKLFTKYGKISFYPKYDKKKKRYLKCAYSDLDHSFEFLIIKNDKIPKWILKNNKFFFKFLSGYFDAEGCLTIYFNRKYGSINWIIKSYDKNILEQIVNKLNSTGLIVQKPKIVKKADNINYNRDYWFIGTGIKLQIFKLLNKMDLKHEEKIMKQNLAKELEDNKWKKAEDKIIYLRNKIKNEVKHLNIEAQTAWIQKHKF